jgi:hypothetical protein
VAAGGGAAAVAVSSGDDAGYGPPDAEPIQFVESIERFAPQPGSVEEVAASLAKRFTTIEGVGIGADGEGSIDLTMPIAEYAEIPFNYAVWEATLFAGVLRDQLAANGEDLSNLHVLMLLTTPDGVLHRSGVGLGKTTLYQRFGSVDRAVFEAAAAKHGLTVERVETITPHQDAYIVEVKTPDAADLTKRIFHDGLSLNDMSGIDPTHVEGLYFLVVDEGGKPVLAVWYAPRAATGGRWVRPDLDERQRPVTPPTPAESVPYG